MSVCASKLSVPLSSSRVAQSSRNLSKPGLALSSKIPASKACYVSKSPSPQPQLPVTKTVTPQPPTAKPPPPPPPPKKHTKFSNDDHVARCKTQPSNECSSVLDDTLDYYEKV